MVNKFLSLALLVTIFVILKPSETLACPICFSGDLDSSITQSVNWAIFTLMGITSGVLSGLVAFIVHLVKHSRQALGHKPKLTEGDM